jgi:branched-subunit amino acid ABC-type transport system permease component
MMGTIRSVVDIWSPTWSVAVFYLALVLVLTFRPQACSGSVEARAQ